MYYQISGKTGSKAIFHTAILLLLYFTWSCKQNSLKEVPILKTLPITGLTTSSVKTGGEISSEGSGSVVARGVCWSRIQNPTATNSDSTTSDGQGIGTFSSTITGLKPGVTYYIKAYATNNAGIGYGAQVTTLIAPVVPTITTADITVVSDTIAFGGGEITNDGGSPILGRGICWNFLKNPTWSAIPGDPNTSDGSGSGRFLSTLKLSKKDYNKTYYVRAYARNSIGIAYGSELSFSPAKLLVMDRDSNFYNIVKLGTQVWMVGNLKTTKFNDGSLLPYVEDASAWSSRINSGYCWYEGDESSSKNTYGALYNWYAVNSGNLCPTGWHVPSDDEWNVLSSYLGGTTLAGGKLKETGTLHWTTPNGGATNETLYTALPGGCRTNTGLYENLGSYGQWWSSTPGTANVSYYRYLYFGNGSITRSFVNQKYGLSVRCLKN